MATLGNNLQLTIEILLKLPAKDLLRLKSVCKLWYAIISDPTFGNEHLSISHQHKQQQHLLLKRLLTNNSGKKQIILSTLKFPLPLDPFLSLLHLDLPFLEDFPYLVIRDHSHALVCLSDLRDVFLCNPTTREIRKLPRSILLFTEPPIEPRCYESVTMAVGFGYDPKSKDFKVVRVVNFREGYGHYFLDPRVEIYDLSKDRWRGIKTPVRAHVFWMPSFEMYHDGTYYWWAYNQGKEDTEFIQSFDMSKEVFGRISVPESFSIETKWEKYRSVGVLNGSIVLLHYPWKGNVKRFDIWEMEKDESGAVLWSKLLTIGPLSGIDKPLYFVSSDEILMESNEEQVILYNITTQRTEKLPLKGDPDMFQATFLFQSLMSVREGNNTMSYGF